MPRANPIRITTLDEYQALASRTGSFWDDKPLPEHRMLVALGLAGEAGEAAEVVKKEVGHGHAVDAAKIAEELGDTLWYLSELARTYGISLSKVAELNIEKIAVRYPDGFSPERSQNR